MGSRALVVLGIVRMIRIFRLFHLAKNYQTVQIIAVSLVQSYRELCLLLVLLVCSSVFFACLLFYVEVNHDNISNIPLGIWWAMITMMTVGYGDVQPISGGGYVVASLCAVTGILIIALPTPIIVNNFSRLYDTFRVCEQLANRSKAEETGCKIVRGKQKVFPLIDDVNDGDKKLNGEMN